MMSLLYSYIQTVWFTKQYVNIRYLIPRKMPFFHPCSYIWKTQRKAKIARWSVWFNYSAVLFHVCPRVFYSHSEPLGATMVRTDIHKHCTEHLINWSDTIIATFIRLTFVLGCISRVSPEIFKLQTVQEKCRKRHSIHLRHR